MKIIQIYEEATHEASGNYATAAVVIPVVNSIMRSLEISDSDAVVTRMKKEMLRSLRKRYRLMESNEYYAIATLLDPRFKQRVFSSSSSAALAKRMLIASHERMEDHEEQSCTIVTKCARLDRDDSSSSTATKKRSSLLLNIVRSSWMRILKQKLHQCLHSLWLISILRNQHTQENQILFSTGKVS